MTVPNRATDSTRREMPRHKLSGIDSVGVTQAFRVELGRDKPGPFAAAAEEIACGCHHFSVIHTDFLIGNYTEDVGVISLRMTEMPDFCLVCLETSAVTSA